MHIHILGICGTFMGGIAVLAQQQGHHVTGSDANVYPPMSTQLEAHGITLLQRYHPEHLDPEPDCIVIGNAIKRGNPELEAILARGIPYTSGPQWLADHVLAKRWVLAVAGTHGKTTTSSMLAWILEFVGLKPGFLIGGIPNNFGISARLGEAPFFVIEADEYDSAYFDKRSKFIHYRPRTAILNNLEYDHADIFPDIKAIQQQFHHLVRTVPGNGLFVCPDDDANLAIVLEQGCWTPVQYIGSDHAYWHAKLDAADGSCFTVYRNQNAIGKVKWALLGNHNVRNALAAIAAAQHAGVMAENAIAALNKFSGVKRRMEVRGQINGVTIYDDFAHHPTAIATTLAGLRQRVGKQRIIAILELASNTMRAGVHKDTLVSALQLADQVVIARPKPVDWGIDSVAAAMIAPAQVCDDIATIVKTVTQQVRPDDHIVVMSNSGFENVHDKLLIALEDLS